LRSQINRYRIKYLCYEFLRQRINNLSYESTGTGSSFELKGTGSNFESKGIGSSFESKGTSLKTSALSQKVENIKNLNFESTDAGSRTSAFAFCR
jgi:hypothetical protein